MPSRSKRSSLADVRFFRALEKAASVAAACRRAGYSRAAVYRWRAADAAFAERWRIAAAMAEDVLAAEADRRERDGVPVDEVLVRNSRGPRRYSDPLLLARLKALRPDLYRDAPLAPRARARRAPAVYESGGGVTVIDTALPVPSPKKSLRSGAARMLPSGADGTSGTRKWHT
jgi:hypothetical protein